MTALARIEAAGFTVRLKENGNLGVSPLDKLTDTRMAYLRTHKAEIITELRAASDGSVTPSDEREILAWLSRIGEKDAETIQEVIDKCSRDPEALAYFLGRAKGAPTQKPMQVKCIDCQHWQSFYAHGKATGLCNAGVQPSGVVHWFDTPKMCGSFTEGSTPSLGARR